ncbi:hypothetical protein NDU88_000819 [Pleurodeles waltl]|uniref:Uncharacterized protein n=1 Tax=Pleurodeles waltl TaxID=8319 RepID=A0AAV7WLS8_PLEWA|nr:hypothetical protein NDU88_000819 [Pleurodeles waltl]
MKESQTHPLCSPNAHGVLQGALAQGARGLAVSHPGLQQASARARCGPAACFPSCTGRVPLIAGVHADRKQVGMGRVSSGSGSAPATSA